MNIYECEELFKKLNPGKKVSLELDEKCHRTHEIIYTDGNPNPVHHIESTQVKVSIEGQESFYVPILPHRECCDWELMKNILNEKMRKF